MAAALSAIVGRTGEVDEISARLTDARRERLAEIAKTVSDRQSARPDRPAAIRGEEARQVESTARAIQAPQPSRAASDGGRPTLSASLRSLLGGEQQPPAAAASTQIIGQLIDALRAYENGAR